MPGARMVPHLMAALAGPLLDLVAAAVEVEELEQAAPAETVAA